MAFRQCFFDTPEVTKILPTVVKNLKEGIKLYFLAQGTEPKRFFLFSRVTNYKGRD